MSSHVNFDIMMSTHFLVVFFPGLLEKVKYPDLIFITKFPSITSVHFKDAITTLLCWGLFKNLTEYNFVKLSA